jgi:ATP-dependent DNA helicase PIF1
VFLSHELSIMDFLFSRCQSSATDDQLKEATALASTGTIGDVDKLLSWLNASAASPSGTTLCAACCEAIEQIAQRGDWEGEAGRPLARAPQVLNRLARCNGDSGVRARAAQAVQAVEQAIAYLPAWPLHASPSSSLCARGPLQPLPQSTSQQPALPPVVPHPSSLTEAPKPPTWADALSAAGQDGGEVAAAKRSRGPSASELGVKLENISLYQALVALRARLAEGKPAYQVASNQVLAMIANKRPTSRLQLLEINGIGKAKADSYGDSILRCVAEHARPKSESVAGSVDAPTAADDAAAAKAEGSSPLLASDEPSAAPQMSNEQQRAAEAVRQGDSIFLTGGAGTGKSYTLKSIIDLLRMMYGREAVFVTASTGIAACALGGTTVHSFAGIGLGRDSAKELADKVASKQAVCKRWLSCRALVIDEISMLDGTLFEKLDFVARTVRGARCMPTTHDPSDEPFGGIQLVLCGDFFQLPPVGMERDPTVRFLFETDAWREAQLLPIVLTKTFRQKEAGFIALLDEMRRARLSPFSIAQLQHHVSHPPEQFVRGARGGAPPLTSTAQAPQPIATAAAPPADAGGEPSPAMVAFPVPAGAGAPPVGLFLSTRLYPNNESSDSENQMRLDALAHGEGAALRIWMSYDEGAPNLIKDCIAQPRLSLRLGAQVMLLKNLDQQAKLVNGSRGVVTGFEAPAVDERLKRVTMHPKDMPPLVPRVAFQVDPLAGAAGWLTRVVYPEEWTVEEGGRTVASRTQVPLKLAWSISIHKSQGMTIPSLEVELSSCFEAGQAYVALSRAVSLQQTRIVSFAPGKVVAHRKVVDFYAALEAEASDDPRWSGAAGSAPDAHDGAHAAGGGGGSGGWAAGAGAAAQPPAPQPQTPSLSEEQKARIHANKLAALAKRQQSAAASASASLAVTPPPHAGTPWHLQATVPSSFPTVPSGYGYGCFPGGVPQQGWHCPGGVPQQGWR